MDTFKNERPNSQLQIGPRSVLKLTDFTNGSRYWHVVGVWDKTYFKFL